MKSYCLICPVLMGLQVEHSIFRCLQQALPGWDGPSWYIVSDVPCSYQWNTDVSGQIRSDRGWGINTMRLKQDGRHFADNDFKCIFLNENVRISIDISLKFIPNGPIDNIPALVQIMAWRRPGDKPLSEPMMVWSADAYMLHSASMS